MIISNLTERQQRLIATCKRAGYGWKKFAISVEASGSCTHKQEDMLGSMVQRINVAEKIKAGYYKTYRRSSGRYHYPDGDISDEEASRSHDYF